jgi:hypothetical protein
MMNVRIVVLGSSLVVIAFDGLGALAARQWEFPYTRLGIGSLIIYGVAGYLAAHASTIRGGVLAAASVGLVDATVGWTVSSLIGPGRLRSENGSLINIGIVILFVVCLAAGVGLIAGFVGYLGQRSWSRQR